MSKKTFYTILMVAIGLLTIGGLVWFFFFRPTAPITTPEGPGLATFSQSAAKGWAPLNEKPVVSARFNGDNVLFYDFFGKFWQLKGGDAKPTPLDQTAIENPAKIIWSSGVKNIVKAGSNQSDIFYTLSDFDKKIFSDLPNNMEHPSFSPDDKKIVYQISNPQTNSLMISEPDGKNQKVLIKNFKLRDVVLDWPKTNQIALTSSPSGLAAGSLWVLDTRNLNITKLIGGLLGLETLFSPDGASFIYSYTDQNGQAPKLGASKNGTIRDLNNVSTLVDKCVWASDSINIYCAIPREWPDVATLPDDYYKNTFSTDDDLWKINTKTDEKNLVFNNIGDIVNLQLNADNTVLIFISRNSRFLYRLDLKTLK